MQWIRAVRASQSFARWWMTCLTVEKKKKTWLYSQRPSLVGLLLEVLENFLRGPSDLVLVTPADA